MKNQGTKLQAWKLYNSPYLNQEQKIKLDRLQSDSGKLSSKSKRFIMRMQQIHNVFVKVAKEESK